MHSDRERRMISSTELRRRSGLSDRRLNYWTQHGVLRPENGPRPGPGYRLRWSEDEVAVAEVVRRVADALGNNTTSVSILAGIAEAHRAGRLHIDVGGVRISWGMMCLSR